MGFRLVIDTIYGSCQSGAKVANVNQNVRLRHDSRSVAREASAGRTDRAIIIFYHLVIQQRAGHVHRKGKIEIKKDSSVNGDLTIEDEAYFKGSIEIEKSAEKEGDKTCSRGRHLHRLCRRRARKRRSTYFLLWCAAR
jgi:hypothetical protein